MIKFNDYHVFDLYSTIIFKLSPQTLHFYLYRNFIIIIIIIQEEKSKMLGLLSPYLINSSIPTIDSNIIRLPLFNLIPLHLCITVGNGLHQRRKITTHFKSRDRIFLPTFEQINQLSNNSSPKRGDPKLGLSLAILVRIISCFGTIIVGIEKSFCQRNSSLGSASRGTIFRNVAVKKKGIKSLSMNFIKLASK